MLARYAADGDRGVQIEEVAGGVRLITRPEMNGWLRRFFEVSGSSKLSMAALETLAIIAYRQPMTGPEIQELRGVNPSGVLKTLLDRHLVRIAGRKEVVGRPFLYCTTREFLVHFGLKSLRDLPPLEEFEDAFEEVADGEAPPDPGLGAGPDGDREETVLRTAAALEEREADDEPDEPEPPDEPHPSDRPRAHRPAEPHPPTSPEPHPPTSPEPVEGRPPEHDAEAGQPVPAGQEGPR